MQVYQKYKKWLKPTTELPIIDRFIGKQKCLYHLVLIILPPRIRSTGNAQSIIILYLNSTDRSSFWELLLSFLQELLSFS